MSFRIQQSIFRTRELLFTLLLLTAAAQAGLSVRLTPAEGSLFIYEPFTLLLESETEIEPPEIPLVDGFVVTGIEPLPDSQNLRIEIMPEQAGTLTIPPLTVRSGEETVQTQPLRIAISAPRKAEEMNLKIEFSTLHPVVDQPVKMTITWTSEVPFTRCQELLMELPILRNPDWEVYPIDPGVAENKRIGLPVNNQRIIAEKMTDETTEQLRFSFMLIAHRAGPTAPMTARLNCALMQDKRASSQYPSYFDNHFFNPTEKNDRFERIWLAAALPVLMVDALPVQGRTLRYSGIVGSCTAKCVIRPEETVVGQPMLLTVELNDLPFGKSIQSIPDATLDDLGAEFKRTLKPLHETAGETGRSFTYIVRPLRSGVTTVPALAFQIFDPVQKIYRTLRTQPLRIRVDPDGENTVYQPHLSEDRKPKTPIKGIRGNWTESKLHMNTTTMLESLTRNAWAFWLLPPLLWLALRPWLRRRDRCRRDPAYARTLRAKRNFNSQAQHDEESAWVAYLADRFNLQAEAVTFEAVAPKLDEWQVPAELTQAVHEQFLKQDTAHYAPPGTPVNPAPSIRELVRRIEKAMPLLLVLTCLLPALNSGAATPDTLFRNAMEIRAEKPDEAVPIFSQAALEFEAENEFINAANSWFFANENGRALANYRAAESRTPWNKQVREGINFIRTQRADVFQTPERSHSRIIKTWNQFGRWSPAIRGGLLTLVYLAGWTAFLIARFRGKTIPRRTWICIGILGAIPSISLIGSGFQAKEGVIIQPAEARLGPGYAYDKAYETTLHESTEFRWLEQRDGWVHARLPDDSDAWLRETVCAKVR